MLAGVLLHVIEPAFPVNLAMDCFPFVQGRPLYLLTYNVHYCPVILLLEDVADGETAEGTLIVGLAARGGIETGLIQNQPQAIVQSDLFENLGLKLLLIGIVMVQLLGHLSPTTVHGTRNFQTNP